MFPNFQKQFSKKIFNYSMNNLFRQRDAYILYLQKKLFIELLLFRRHKTFKLKLYFYPLIKLICYA